MVFEMAGVWLLVIGAILAFFAIAGVLPGKKKIGGAIALVFIVAGLVLAGPLLGGLLAVAPADDGEEFGGATYDVRFADASPWNANAPTGASQIVNPEFTVLDILANDTNWNGLTSTVSDLDFLVSRTDAGSANDQQTIFLDIGTVDTITDTAGGTTRTLLDFIDAEERFDALWSETGGGGETPVARVSGNRFSSSLIPGDVGDFQLTFDINEGAFGSSGPSVVGSSYTLTVVLAGQVMTINMVVTAA